MTPRAAPAADVRPVGSARFGGRQGVDERLERVAELGRRGPVGGVPLEAGREQSLEHVGHSVGRARLVLELRMRQLGARPWIRQLAGECLVHGHPEPPDVAGRPDFAPMGRVALLRGHVWLRADVASQRAELDDRARHAQVDQARRAGHDDVARLDVEVDDALAGQVVEHRAEVERERQDLFQDQPVAANQRRQPRALDELEHQMRALRRRLGVEGAHEQRVREPGQQAGLGLKDAPRAAIAGLPGPKQLGHNERAQALVPGQPRLVAVAAAEQPDGPSAGRDLVALGEPPRVHGADARATP
jgi:hypothetical protein